MKWAIFIFFPWLSVSQAFEWVSFEMTQRTNKEGKTSEIRSLVYFDNQNQMTIRQLYPMEIYVKNNSDGELIIYNPKTNEVFQMMNYMLSSQQNQFYFFLQGKTDDMGLVDMGFTLNGSRLEDGLLISNYAVPPEVKKYFDHIEIVHDGQKPIFIGYINKKGEYLKKVFYYDYIVDLDILFPGSITEINYIGKHDSIITKTSFSEFKVDDWDHKEMVEFTVPDDAKLIE